MKTMRAFAAASLLIVLMGGCGSDSVEELAIVGTGSAYTGLPAELSAGIYSVTFTNNAAVPDAPLLIERGTATPEQFLVDFAPVLEGGPFPDYLTKVVGFETTAPGASVTTTLTIPAGEYLFVSFFENETPNAAYTEVTVTGSGPDVEDLPDEGTVFAAHEYGFTISGLKAGPQTATFRNDGPLQVHHGVFVKFADGTTEQEAGDLLATLFSLEEGQEPPEGVEFPEDVVDTGVFSAGTGGTFEIDLEAGGTYAVMCFISDRQGGPPHAIAHQMIQPFVVEG